MIVAMALVVPFAPRGEIVEDSDAAGFRRREESVCEVAADEAGASDDEIASLVQQHFDGPLKDTDGYLNLI
jgi:hypothetical protein